MKRQRGLATLEYDVLSVIWRSGEVTVSKVRDELEAEGKPLALTTVSTVLDRLYRKGLVKRRLSESKGTPRYIYSAGVTKEDYERGVVSDLLDRLLDKMAEPTISRLMELMAEDERDRELLSKYLEKLKRDKK